MLWPATPGQMGQHGSHALDYQLLRFSSPLQVEIQRLKLARDWQPFLRPTRHREGFFFNPDAGRNAPTLPPEWGRGPGMAAVDPLLPFDANAPLLQARSLCIRAPPTVPAA